MVEKEEKEEVNMAKGQVVKGRLYVSLQYDHWYGKNISYRISLSITLLCIQIEGCVEVKRRGNAKNKRYALSEAKTWR